MKKTLLTLALGLTLVLTAATAQATPITLTIGGAYYIGKVDPSQPANEASQAGYINYLLDMGTGTTSASKMYTRSALACGDTIECVDVTATGADRINHDPDKNIIADLTNLDLSSWTYLLAKHGTASYVWYVAGQKDVTLLEKHSPVEKRGLSHFTLFNPITLTPDTQTVPDGGATLGLLGLGMVGLGYLRRRMF